MTSGRNIAERQADYTELLYERLCAEREAAERKPVRRPTAMRRAQTDVGVDPWWQALNEKGENDDV